VDFSRTDAQREILDLVDRLMRKHLPPEEVRRRDATHDDCSDLLKIYGDAGLLALPFPEKLGGIEADRLTVMLVNERLGYHASIAASLYSTNVDFGGMPLLAFGTDAQREQLIPKLMRGELRFSFALTESNAGSDAAGLVTRARKTASGWAIIGRKLWITNANTADYLVIACRTRPGSAGRDGVSVLLVPRRAQGIHMTPLSKVGNNCMSSWDIGLDDVEVSQDALIGEEGQGFRVLMHTLQYSRTSQAAKAVGIAQTALDEAKRYAVERVQFGKRIADFQVIRHRLVDMQTRVDQARWIAYHAGWLMSKGVRCRKEAAQAKVVASEALQYVTHHGMQITASLGYSMDGDMQRYWRDSRLYSFGEGTNELQRDLIAKEMGL
jgi:alkylation response protein AidB-like acyl-CoA dehydrogenase